MSDRDLLKALGLNDRTISITFDDDYQRIVERKVDDYLKKIDEEKQKEDSIKYLKDEYARFQKKEEFVEMFNDPYVFRKIKNKLILEKFVNDCKYCWGIDVSGQYGKQTKPKHK